MVMSKSDPSVARISADIIGRGGVVILPCDTIYGFTGSFPAADARIREIKGRGEVKPFLRLIRMRDAAALPLSRIDAELLDLWPGPLTLIVPCRDGGTAGIRVPADPFVQDILELFGSPLISTSVNRSGSPSVIKIGEIIREFGPEVDLIVDDGDREGALPSTILDITVFPYRIVRKGALELPAQILKNCVDA
jgi:L-threonylcarbamoyladenylate synthase